MIWNHVADSDKSNASLFSYLPYFFGCKTELFHSRMTSNILINLMKFWYKISLDLLKQSQIPRSVL